MIQHFFKRVFRLTEQNPVYPARLESSHGKVIPLSPRRSAAPIKPLEQRPDDDPGPRAA